MMAVGEIFLILMAAAFTFPFWFPVLMGVFGATLGLFGAMIGIFMAVLVLGMVACLLFFFFAWPLLLALAVLAFVLRMLFPRTTPKRLV
ncbi:hypothetical protein NAC44_05885 [Allorhizobium sp. BGMRC 0089]|uniref:hypothetical protein n=1 Tax=Allorhizobium sonneratiae TaxID=2934936 RepID=UPI0020332083|nr:hypothetical protein [Allorhizobium sonneratiae]MCM2291856.1 hypothetical protein [Allorhizobium sonneratiae]